MIIMKSFEKTDFLQLVIKGCVHYILVDCFLDLNESTCQTRENVFYFTSKALFVLEKIKF